MVSRFVTHGHQRYPPSTIGRMGHGLGLELTEWPCMTNWDTTLLRPGMVITLEPSVSIDGEPALPGGILVHEENLVIRENGFELLSRRSPWDMDELVLPWGPLPQEVDADHAFDGADSPVSSLPADEELVVNNAGRFEQFQKITLTPRDSGTTGTRTQPLNGSPEFVLRLDGGGHASTDFGEDLPTPARTGALDSPLFNRSCPMLAEVKEHLRRCLGEAKGGVDEAKVVWLAWMDEGKILAAVGAEGTTPAAHPVQRWLQARGLSPPASLLEWNRQQVRIETEVLKEFGLGADLLALPHADLGCSAIMDGMTKCK